jgi:hypothetical protein
MSRVDSLRKKANDLVETALLFVKIMVGKVKEDHSKMFTEAGVQDRLEYFCTIAFVWCVCVRLSKEIEEEFRTPLETIVREHLDEWYFESSNAIDDVHGFVTAGLLQEQDRSKRGFLLFGLAAKWAVDSSYYGKEIATSYTDNFTNMFAEMFMAESSGYWRD